MTPLLKGALGVLTVGTVAGVGYAGSTYFSNDNKEPIKPQKSMSELIKDKFEYILLESNDDTNWTTNWEKYKANNKDKENEQDILALGGWVKGSTVDLKNKLKLKCQELSASTDNWNYGYVTEYCSRAVTIEDEAKKDELIILAKKDTKEDATTWKEKIANKQDLIKHFTNLGITNSIDLAASHLREKCEAKITMKKQEDKYEENYESYKAVCTNPKEAD